MASGLFLSLGGYISYQVFSGRLDGIRVAILPLKTSALDVEAQPYGSGIADALRNSLRAIPVFSVPAHTSSEAVMRAGLDIARGPEGTYVYLVMGSAWNTSGF